MIASPGDGGCSTSRDTTILITSWPSTRMDGSRTPMSRQQPRKPAARNARRRLRRLLLARRGRHWLHQHLRGIFSVAQVGVQGLPSLAAAKSSPRGSRSLHRGFSLGSRPGGALPSPLAAGPPRWACLRSFKLIHWRILAAPACEVRTKLSQSRLGPRPACVRISTTSPLDWWMLKLGTRICPFLSRRPRTARSHLGVNGVCWRNRWACRRAAAPTLSL